VKPAVKSHTNTIVATDSLWSIDTCDFGCSSIMPDVIGNFVEGHSHSVEGAAHLNNSIMSCQCLELVGGCDKRQPCVLGHSSCHSCVKALLGVQSCASIYCDALLGTVKNIYGFLSRVTMAELLGYVTHVLLQKLRPDVSDSKSPNMTTRVQPTAALLHEEGAAAQVYVAHIASICHANWQSSLCPNHMLHCNTMYVHASLDLFCHAHLCQQLCLLEQADTSEARHP